MIFVDTGAWFALLIPDDTDHLAASGWLAQNRELLVTSDYVIDETLTLLKARGQMSRALASGRDAFAGRLARIHYLSESEIRASWRTFASFTDKGWSFTDCTSKLIIDRLRIKRAFSFDDHFRQFGSVVVVP
ncbi:MAG: type II toxin-antitoxin system VapC family toxin [Tepidisphaeraceae bacterium]